MKLPLQNVVAGLVVRKEMMMKTETWVNIPLHRICTSSERRKWERALFEYTLVSGKWTRNNRKEV